jgi:hypothetical protein
VLSAIRAIAHVDEALIASEAEVLEAARGYWWEYPGVPWRPLGYWWEYPGVPWRPLEGRGSTPACSGVASDYRGCS